VHTVVVGGGVVGVTTAYYLAAQGHSVTIVEQRSELGQDATGGNAGLIAPSHSFAWASPQAPGMLWRSLRGERTAIRVKPRADPCFLGWGVQFLGVAQHRVVLAVWALSGALAAIGGIELAMQSAATPQLGFSLMLPVFSAAIVGGLGSVAGAIIASFGVALLESVVLAMDFGGLGAVPVSYRPAIGFVFLILALIFRPQGLLGVRPRHV
jgi:hypothetical protein